MRTSRRHAIKDPESRQDMHMCARVAFNMLSDTVDPSKEVKQEGQLIF